MYTYIYTFYFAVFLSHLKIDLEISCYSARLKVIIWSLGKLLLLFAQDTNKNLLWQVTKEGIIYVYYHCFTAITNLFFRLFKNCTYIVHKVFVRLLIGCCRLCFIKLSFQSCFIFQQFC